MMSATFKEYMVKQKKTTKDILAQAAILFFSIVIVSLAVAVGGTLLGTVSLVGVILVGGYLFTMFNREYEYILTESELDIDVVYNRSRRKRVITVNLKKMDLIAAVDDERYKNEIQTKNIAKVINASDNSNDKNTYVILGETQFGISKIIISPSEDFLDEMHKQAPNKVFRRM